MSEKRDRYLWFGDVPARCRPALRSSAAASPGRPEAVFRDAVIGGGPDRSSDGEPGKKPPSCLVYQSGARLDLPDDSFAYERTGRRPADLPPILADSVVKSCAAVDAYCRKPGGRGRPDHAPSSLRLGGPGTRSMHRSRGRLRLTATAVAQGVTWRIAEAAMAPAPASRPGTTGPRRRRRTSYGASGSGRARPARCV